jgi:hypothetical protein
MIDLCLKSPQKNGMGQVEHWFNEKLWPIGCLLYLKFTKANILRGNV